MESPDFGLSLSFSLWYGRPLVACRKAVSGSTPGLWWWALSLVGFGRKGCLFSVKRSTSYAIGRYNVVDSAFYLMSI